MAEVDYSSTSDKKVGNVTMNIFVRDLVQAPSDPRFRGTVVNVFDKCTHHTDCVFVKIEWFNGTDQTIHSTSIIVVESPVTDELVKRYEADKEHQGAKVSASDELDISGENTKFKTFVRNSLTLYRNWQKGHLTPQDAYAAFGLQERKLLESPEVFNPEDLIEWRAVDSDEWIPGVFIRTSENHPSNAVVRLFGEGHDGRESRVAVKALRRRVFHTKVDTSDERDQAYEVYKSALSSPWSAKRDVLNEMGNEPYLVIGDFAYVMGEEGSIFQIPVKYVRTPDSANPDELVFTPMWREAVEIIEKDAVWVTRLAHVFFDIGNIRDIMRQSGVEVKTPKIPKSDLVDSGSESDKENKK